MRDLLLMTIICGGALCALRKPWIGALLFTWISVMNPHAQWGWRSADWPVAYIVAVPTIIGLVFTRERHTPLLGPPVWALLAFIVWFSVTLPLSFHLDESLPLWLRSMKIFIMLFVTLALIDDKRKLDWFIGIIVFSLGFYGFKGGVFTILTGGNYRVWGPGGFIEGNNEIALALVMTLPLMRYVLQQTRRPWLRVVCVATMLLTAITVLGSYSRGALLALLAMSLLLWFKGERKFMWGIILALVGVAILSLMPDQWWSRMETIRTYEQDESALGRINAWHMAWNLALHNFVGGGFSIYDKEVFRLYAPEPDRVHAAHSIYFQILGEHGFVGLFLFMLIGLLTWRTATRLEAVARGAVESKWAGDLGAMIKVSMIGFAVGGMFLSLAYFDLPYDLMAMAVLALHVVRSHAVTQTAAQEATPAGPPMKGRPA